MTDTMLAATIVQPGLLTLASVPIPEPSAREVLVALQGTGVCASNLPLWQGAPWFSYPLEPGTGGHEGWGRIVALGKEAPKHLLGQRVAALSFKSYAEYDVADVDHVVPLPSSLDDVPLPGEALGCAMNILRRSDLGPGHTLAIIGIGFLGALLTQLASKMGVRVIAISRRPFALQVARSCGAEETILMDDHRAILEQINDLTSGRMCPRVIEATGKQWPLDLAGEITAVGGRLMIAGYHQDGPRQVNMQLWNYRGFDVVNAHERDPLVCTRGMRQAISAIDEGLLDPSPLYSHVYPLHALGEAFAATHERPDGFLKAIIEIEQVS